MSSPDIPGLEFEELIATTAFSEVWRAIQPALDRHVAVKVLRSERPDALEFFENEGQLLGRLSRHPNIVTIYESGTVESRPYLVLQFADQGSMARRLESTAIHWIDVVHALDQILDALSFLHGNGIAHGDIKPSNLLVDSQAGSLLGDVAMSGIEGGGLTLAYASPERLRGDPASEASDMYAVGISLYEMLSGRLPFDPSEAGNVLGFAALVQQEEPPNLPPRSAPQPVETLVRLLLSKEPGDRPTSLEAQAILGDLDETVRRDAPSATRSRGPRGSRRIAAAVATIALGGVAGFLALRSGATTDSPDVTVGSSAVTSATATEPIPSPSAASSSTTVATATASTAVSQPPNPDSETPTDREGIAEPLFGVALDEDGQPHRTVEGALAASLIRVGGLTPFTPSISADSVWVAASPETMDGQGSLMILDRSGVPLDHTDAFGPEDERGTRLPATPTAGPLVVGNQAFVSYASPEDPTGSVAGGIVEMMTDPLRQGSVLTWQTVLAPSGTPVAVSDSVFLSYVEPPPADEIGIEWLVGPGLWDNGIEGPGFLVPYDSPLISRFHYIEFEVENAPATTTAGPIAIASSGDFAYVSRCSNDPIFLLPIPVPVDERVAFTGCIFREWPRRGDDFFEFPIDPDQVGTLQRVIHPARDGSLWFVSRERVITRYDPQRHEVTNIVEAGPCPVTDALVGCQFLEETSQGLIAFGAFWVPNPGDGNLYRIDLSTVEVTDVIDVGGTPGTPAATKDAVWVVDVDSGAIHRIDPESRTLTDSATLPCPRGCVGWRRGTEWRYRPVGDGNVVWVPWESTLFRVEATR